MLSRGLHPSAGIADVVQGRRPGQLRICDSRRDVDTASLIEFWIDETERRV